nr:hypothetical protein GCM10020063_040750 [Dactylosporangium thailandense]
MTAPVRGSALGPAAQPPGARPFLARFRQYLRAAWTRALLLVDMRRAARQAELDNAAPDGGGAAPGGAPQPSGPAPSGAPQPSYGPASSPAPSGVRRRGVLRTVWAAARWGGRKIRAGWRRTAGLFRAVGAVLSEKAFERVLDAQEARQAEQRASSRSAGGPSSSSATPPHEGSTAAQGARNVAYTAATAADNIMSGMAGLQPDPELANLGPGSDVTSGRSHGGGLITAAAGPSRRTAPAAVNGSSGTVLGQTRSSSVPARRATEPRPPVENRQAAEAAGMESVNTSRGRRSSREASGAERPYSPPRRSQAAPRGLSN